MQYKPVSVEQSLATATAASLRFQHRLFAREMGMLLPDTLILANVSTVLDLCCGPGAWALDFAKLFPEKQVTAIDDNKEIIRIAQEDAHVAHVANVSFETHSPLKKLPYADDSFDLIHGLRTNRTILPAHWPTVIKELWRLVRPGGWLHLLDFEIGTSSSPALETFMGLVREAMIKEKRTFSNDGAMLTSALLYPQILSQIGCIEVQYNLYPIDIGNQNSFIGRDFAISTIIGDLRAPVFLTRTGLITADALAMLMKQLLYETQQIEFCAVGTLISVIGMKPPVTETVTNRNG